MALKHIAADAMAQLPSPTEAAPDTANRA